jgi:hypothetical protein
MHVLWVILTLAALAASPLLGLGDDHFRPEYAQNAKVRVDVTGAPSAGYFLVSPLHVDTVGLVDHAGVLVHGRLAGPTVNLTPTPYGGYTFYMGTLGRYVTVDDQLRITDTFGVEQPFVTDFHEGYQTRRRRYIVLGTEERTFDMSTVVPGGDPEAILIGAVVQEFDRYGRKTFDWRSLDHVSVHETTGDIDLQTKRIDYIHVNAVTEDSDGNFLISCRNTDQVIKVERASGKILWRLGGTSAKRTDITILNDEIDGFVGFSHQHTPIRARNGDLLLFDNGTLRPSPFSRVVGYRVDENDKTATKTWEYIHSEPQYAPTMGSVQELPDGHILIGWGSTPTGLLATEVDRDGRIHAEVRSTQQPSLSYRVYKAVIGMNGYQRTLDSVRSYPFMSYDSTTYVTLHVDNIVRPVRTVVERHGYPPHEIRFNDVAPCYVFPGRWVIRVEDPLAVVGSTAIDVGRLVGSFSASDVNVYYRPVEGEGAFTPIDGQVVSNTIRLGRIQSGEFMIASAGCPDVALREPLDKSKVTTEDVLLTWTNTIDADGYEIEFSSSPDFADQLRFLRSDYPEIRVVGLEPDKRYYWRVRVIRRSEVGPWTNPWSFNTGIPTTVEDAAADHPVIAMHDDVVRVQHCPEGTEVFVTDVVGRSMLLGSAPAELRLPPRSLGPIFIVLRYPNGRVVREVHLNVETGR